METNIKISNNAIKHLIYLIEGDKIKYHYICTNLNVTWVEELKNSGLLNSENKLTKIGKVVAYKYVKAVKNNMLMFIADDLSFAYWSRDLYATTYLKINVPKNKERFFQYFEKRYNYSFSRTVNSNSIYNYKKSDDINLIYLNENLVSPLLCMLNNPQDKYNVNYIDLLIFKLRLNYGSSGFSPLHRKQYTDIIKMLYLIKNTSN